MTDARTEGGEGQQTGEAVNLPLDTVDEEEHIMSHQVPPANPAGREAIARIAELEAELERANNWNEQVTGFGLDRLDELADAWIERTEITRLFSAVSSVFAKWANDDIIARFKQAQADLAHLSYVEGAISGANIALARHPDTPPAPAVAAGDEVKLRALEWRRMPGYGQMNFRQLREAVAEAIIGNRQALGPFKADLSPGHQTVEGINYNSLNRIVTAFVLAALHPAQGGE